MDEYKPIPYPAWRYHATEAAKVVQTAEEDAALGSGWSKSPSAAKSEPKPEAKLAAVASVAATEPAEEPFPFPVKPKKVK